MYYKKLGIAPSVLVLDQYHNQVVGHTSVGDIPDLIQLEIVLSQAQLVYWAHSSIDEFADEDSYYEFLNWLKNYNVVYRNVVNFNEIIFDDYKWIDSSTNALTENHAVFFGCSFTAGVGLLDYEPSYTTQVAKHFSKQVLNLASSGGSNGLIFDRFTQVDFFPGQIVVVQITYLERLHYCDIDRNLKKILFTHTSGNWSRSLLDIYHKDFLFHELLQKIRAMVTIARAKKLKMVFWLIHYNDEEIYSKADQRYFYHMPEFVPASLMQNYMMDVTNDGSHPGVKSNKFIADMLIKYIETVYNKD